MTSMSAVIAAFGGPPNSGTRSAEGAD